MRHKTNGGDKADRAHMNRLGEVMEARIRRDKCGDAAIKGRIDKLAYVENTIHSDGQGYGCNPKRWTM